MKIAFSTLGCPEWSWEDMVSTAKDFGFDGIEVRGIENELYVPKAKPFLDSNLESTREKLKRLNIEIPCLTSACYLFEKQNTEFYLNEAMTYIDLAEKLGTPYIRVLGDSNPEPTKEIDINFVAQNLSKVAKYAEGKGVMVLIETNGIFAKSDDLISFLEKLENKNVGVLWDIHHPFRFMGEGVEKTYNTLKDYIKFVHIKDSIIENGKIKYKMMGYGDVPVKDAINLLKQNGFDGFISLEWVKRWCIDLDEPGVVFPHFINFIKTIA